MTHIYVIGWADAGPVKIGIARDPERRLAQLQVSCPYGLRVLHARGIGRMARTVELHVHFALEKQRLAGEWFSVTLIEATAAIEQSVVSVKGAEQLPAIEWKEPALKTPRVDMGPLRAVLSQTRAIVSPWPKGSWRNRRKAHLPPLAQ